MQNVILHVWMEEHKSPLADVAVTVLMATLDLNAEVSEHTACARKNAILYRSFTLACCGYVHSYYHLILHEWVQFHLLACMQTALWSVRMEELWTRPPALASVQRIDHLEGNVAVSIMHELMTLWHCDVEQKTSVTIIIIYKHANACSGENTSQHGHVTKYW